MESRLGSTRIGTLLSPQLPRLCDQFQELDPVTRLISLGSLSREAGDARERGVATVG